MFKVGVLIAAAICALPNPSSADDGPWQSRLPNKFEFCREKATFDYSCSQFTATCQIHAIYDPKNHGLKITFVRDGKTIVSEEGHFISVFRCKYGTNLLYFCEYGDSGSGCTVVAYDMNTGRQLWRTKLKALGFFGHYAYGNHVDISVGADEVFIFGRESFGNYVEVLDRATGKTMAHRIYSSVWDRGGVDEVQAKLPRR